MCNTHTQMRKWFLLFVEVKKESDFKRYQRINCVYGLNYPREKCSHARRSSASARGGLSKLNREHA